MIPDLINYFMDYQKDHLENETENKHSGSINLLFFADGCDEPEFTSRITDKLNACFHIEHIFTTTHNSKASSYVELSWSRIKNYICKNIYSPELSQVFWIMF